MLRLNVPSVFLYGGSILPGTFQGQPYVMPSVVPLMQAINHGTEHRAHVITTLSQQGVPAYLKQYAQRIQDLLREYERISGSRVTLEVLDPAPDSDEEEWAQRSGLQAQPLDSELRVFARSASDDKAPIVAMMTALDSIRAAGLRMKSNIKFAFEGEEEAGSTNLEKTLAANKELFAGDLWLLCDGPVHQIGRAHV